MTPEEKKKEYDRKWRAANPEKVREIWRRHDEKRRQARIAAIKSGRLRDRRITWGDAKKERFIAAWNAGVTVFDMAPMFGVNTTNVTKRAIKIGLKPRICAWCPEEDNRLRELWQDPYLTMAHIGDLLGRTKSMVLTRTRHLKLPHRRKFFGNRQWRKRDDKKFRELWFSELSVQQIALQLRRSKSAVGHRRVTLGLLPRGNRTERISFAATKKRPIEKLRGLGPF